MDNQKWQMVSDSALDAVVGGDPLDFGKLTDWGGAGWAKLGGPYVEGILKAVTQNINNVFKAIGLGDIFTFS